MRTGLLILLAIGLCAGCATTADQSSKRPTTPPGKTLVPNDDPCAARLHELCGVLLLYYVKHESLPPTLDDLKHAPGADAVGDFTCPVSHKPYLYTPTGLPSPASPDAVMIVYDAEPSHAGARLAISITPPLPGGPLVPEVILAPESRFPSKSPTTQP